jgi:hypothetical protein
MELIAVYSEKHMEHKCALWLIDQILNLEADGTYSVHYVLKG